MVEDTVAIAAEFILNATRDVLEDGFHAILDQGILAKLRKLNAAHSVSSEKGRR